MNKDNIKTQIIVKKQKINVLRIDNKEYISLTDLAKYADEDDPRLPIQNWMRNKDVILYLGLWESLNNENFKGVEFDTFKNEAGSNKFRISPQRWIKETNAIGIISKSGKNNGITFDKLKEIAVQEKRIKGLQRALSRSKKGSNNRKKLIEKIQRAYQKIRNMRKYYIHNITTKIVKENDVICAETLKVREMIEKEKNHLSKHLNNASFSEIIRQLSYKSKWYNKKLYQVLTYYAVSILLKIDYTDKNAIIIKNIVTL